MGAVRALILEVDEAMLAERARLGLDHSDEMWEGVLHLVPAPAQRHGRLQLALGHILYDAALDRGLRIATEIGVYAADDDWRVPDLAVFAPAAASDRGVDGAPLVVVEVRSPGDESVAKIPWYLARGTSFVVLVDRDSLHVEVHTPDGELAAGGDGLTAIAPLDLRIGSGTASGSLVVEIAGRRSVIEL